MNDSYGSTPRYGCDNLLPVCHWRLVRQCNAHR
jgi:hypothetical protein